VRKGDHFALSVRPDAPYLRAVEWIVKLFAGDSRKGKPEVPYLSHLFGVAALVMHDGGSEAEIVAGLLHDVMEDKHKSRRKIAKKIGGEIGVEVARIVFACSDGVDHKGRAVDECGNVIAERGPATWRPRKERYLSHLRAADDPVLRVSAADKLDNARELLDDVYRYGSGTMRRFNAPPEDQLWWYRSVCEVFNERLPASSLPPRLVTTVDTVAHLLNIEEATRVWELAHLVQVAERQRGRGHNRTEPLTIWTFIDDDQGFIQWRDARPGAYIVNHDRDPRPAYLKLHRASCPTLQTASVYATARWTTAYAKTCSDDLNELQRWAGQIGGELDPCRFCNP
jgi:hypothetical protein